MSATNPTESTSTSAKRLGLIARARRALLGNDDLSSSQLDTLCKELKNYSQFAYAAEILLLKMAKDEEQGRPVSLQDHQKLALYLYKDYSLPSVFKFAKALNVLCTHDDLAVTVDCESLGLTGAIYKRKWQFDHQFKNLVLSRHYYKRGYESWKQYLRPDAANRNSKQCDDGYTGINYAYVCELMAVEELEEYGKLTGITNDILDKLDEAEKVRKFILGQFVAGIDAPEPVLKRQDCAKWVYATIAEAYFGLKKYEQALFFIRSYLDFYKGEPWEVKSFTQQLLSLSYLQKKQKELYETGGNDAFGKYAAQISQDSLVECLAPFLYNTAAEGEKNKSGISSRIEKGGKAGLALSGGGFRASLFHIGVLAALAEKDELKNIEVLSCVSGGSIIGAYYYIRLKKLLEEKPDDQVTREDYMEMVRAIEKDFLTGVQRNLRMRIFSNLGRNFKMLFNKNYSRTHRLGELYEKHLYKKLLGTKEKIYMHDLFINPAGTTGDTQSFDLALDNWKRQHKVPQLVLNATSVNTGHNWQFTASWMGEPPGNIQPDVDVKPRLRRMYYPEAPAAYRDFRLGYAVGASSCVPVMFEPMPMYGLYPGIDLQLIDGGLHDNQGTAALIEQECNTMFISDASGQLPTTNVKAANELSVFYRSDNILQERLRELQFMDIKERNYTTQLDKLVMVHLKTGLQQKPVNWINCSDPPRSVVYGDLYKDKQLTGYGILKTVQAALSNIRTDLDSFSDKEAYALMYSGYLQAHLEINNLTGADAERDESYWCFSAVREMMTSEERSGEIMKVLQTGSRQFLKLYYLSGLVKTIALIILFALATWLGWKIYKNWDAPLIDISIKAIVIAAAAMILKKFIGGAGFIVNFWGEARKWLTLAGLVIFGFIASNFYILLLNPLYNKIGRLKKKSS